MWPIMILLYHEFTKCCYVSWNLKFSHLLIRRLLLTCHLLCSNVRTSMFTDRYRLLSIHTNFKDHFFSFESIIEFYIILILIIATLYCSWTFFSYFYMVFFITNNKQTNNRGGELLRVEMCNKNLFLTINIP